MQKEILNEDEGGGVSVSSGNITQYIKPVSKPIKRKLKKSMEVNDVVNTDKKKFKKIKESVTTEEVYEVLSTIDDSIILPLVVECEGLYILVEKEDDNG